MSTAFIISQIGNSELDSMCSSVLVPALKSCGLDPKRVDKHNQGGLLKSEIIKFIETADIIVADLTNERPNCYLEVGFTMGRNKFNNLILTAREDHNQDSPNHYPGGPKIHFDLIGYDVLFWHPDRLSEFRTELEKKIKKRLMVIGSSGASLRSIWDSSWIEHQRNEAKPGLFEVLKTPHPGYTEVEFALSEPKPNLTQRELLDAAKGAQIHTFGWPIGAVITERQDYKPRPTDDGIVANISAREHSSHDYWALRRNGDFFLLQSLFEDYRDPSQNTLYFDTRIVRVTEALLYCARLYSRLGVLNTTIVHIGIAHSGLKGRTVRSANPRYPFFGNHSTTQDSFRSEISTALIDIESQLVELVKEFIQPLFMIFDYLEVDHSVYSTMVTNFAQGRIN
jgi:hypothetical protein